jgi:hypothetical protein
MTEEGSYDNIEEADADAAAEKNVTLDVTVTFQKYRTLDVGEHPHFVLGDSWVTHLITRYISFLK